MRIVNSIPPHQRLTIKTSTLPLLIDPIPSEPLVTLESKSTPILDAPSKHIYNFFQEKKYIPPIAQQRFMVKYPNMLLDWNKVYLLPRIQQPPDCAKTSTNLKPYPQSITLTISKENRVFFTEYFLLFIISFMLLKKLH